MFGIRKRNDNSKNENLAKEKLKEQFKITWNFSDNDIYSVIWSVEKNIPFILILNRYERKCLVAKEWYEFNGSTWELVISLSRKECINLYWYYRRKQSMEWYGRDIRNDNDAEQTERISRAFLDEYFEDYKRYKKR